MSLTNNILKYIFPLFLLLFVTEYSCTTKKNTVVTRTFHNITAKYNGYFNGNESFKEGVAQLEASWQDDYTNVLPMFKYGDASKATAAFPAMDKAITKATAVIQRHEITVEPKQGKKAKKQKPKTKKNTGEKVYRQWIDDSYLLIGKAHFYKGEYNQAAEMFEYVAKKYKKYSTRYDAMLWAMRTFIESGEFAKAQTLFDLLGDKKVFRKMNGGQQAGFAALEAHFLLKQKNYGSSIEPMLKAVATCREKPLRTRFIFILAQLYEKMGNLEKAKQNYMRVTQMRPTYEMSFQAQLKRAQLAGVNDKNRKELVRQLQKMTRDEKNKEYLGALYLALADIMEKENNIPSALDYLKLAVQSAGEDVIVKGNAYHRMASIYFDRPDYLLSKLYYDSAVATLPLTYNNYNKILSRRNTLRDIVRYMNIISLEDSLLRISGFNDKAKEKLVQGIIDKINEQEEKKKQEQQSQAPIINQPSNIQNQNTQSGSQWYFYNTATVSFGYSEFLRKWGNRKLEDNWRRSNKQSFTGMEAEGDSAVAEEGEAPPPSASDLKNKNFYLKNIPADEQQKENSKNKIIEAYYNLGILFKEQLENNLQAIKTFEELLQKYPDNKYLLPSCFQLYRLYMAAGNMERSDYYKNLILSKEPDGDYAKVIRNPDYVKEILSENKKINRYYEETYAEYLAGNFQEVISRCIQSDSLFRGNGLAPKFVYLKTLSIGKTAPLPDFEAALKGVIGKYPKDPVSAQAQGILVYINSMKGKIDAVKDTVTKLFMLDENARHYYLLIGNKNIDAAKQKILFSNYNSVFFSNDKLKVESILLDSAHSIIVVKEFPGKGKAMLYYDAIRQSNTVLVQLNPDDYSACIISSVNFPVFFEIKNPPQYLAFFEEKYLKK